jgi:mannosyltransferase OCH1-like enzyme
MNLFKPKPIMYKIPRSIPTFKLKNYYNSIIPLDVYQTWYTKDLPQKMKENLEFNKCANPKLNWHIYDDNDCREFIKNNFEQDVLDAFDNLIPGAYKADLWRYCILYIKGGIYLDIKFRCVNGFKLIALTEKEHFPTDVPIPIEENNGVYNGFMMSLPRNSKLLNAINKLVENVKHKFYGNSSIDPTGPNMLGNFFDYDEKKNSVTKRYVGNQGNGISIGGIIILDEYHEYRNEQKSVSIHYNENWKNKNIYK